MKILLRKTGLLLLVLLFVVPASAKVVYGVRVGGAYSSLIEKVGREYNSGSRFGFSVAGLAEIPLPKNFSIRPEIAFVNKGGSFFPNSSVGGIVEPTSCWYYALQIPINVAYTFRFTDVRFSVFTGPALDFSLFGKMKNGGDSHSISFGQTEKHDLKMFDLGVNVGLSVEYSQFFFTVDALMGTLDKRTRTLEGESSLYQNNVTFSLGYVFR